MEEKVKPIYRSDKASFEEHDQFFNEVGRIKGGQADGQAEDDDCTPGEFIKKLFHGFIVSFTKSQLKKKQQKKQLSAYPCEYNRQRIMLSDVLAVICLSLNH